MIITDGTVPVFSADLSFACSSASPLF